MVHYHALFSDETEEKQQRIATPLFTWLGLAGCFLLFVSLPGWAIITGLLVLFLAAGIRELALGRNGKSREVFSSSSS